MTSLPGFFKLEWNFQDLVHSSSTQVIKDSQPETTYFIYDSEGSRVRKITERSSIDSQAARKMKETLYLNGAEIYRVYAGNGVTIRMQKNTSCVTGETTVALIERKLDNPEPLVRYQAAAGLELDDDGHIISYEEYSPFGATTHQARQRDVEPPRWQNLPSA